MPIADEVMFVRELIFCLAMNKGCMQVIIFNFQKTVRTPFLVSVGLAELAKYLTPHHPFPPFPRPPPPNSRLPPLPATIAHVQRINTNSK